MICPNCGETVPEGSTICPSCGAAIPPDVPERRGLSREAKYSIGVAVGCLGLICFLCASLLVFASVPDTRGLLISIGAAAVPALFYVFVVLWLDRYEREPFRLLVGAFFWGSVVAVVLAAILEFSGALIVGSIAGSDAADFVISVFGAPLAEEASKGLVLLLLFFILRNEFDDTLDGIVYGSVVGLGFAMTENILYFGRQYMEGGVGPLAELFVVRVVLSGLAHALYTGTTGAGLGYARETTNRALQIVVPLFAFALAVGQHLLWNGTLQFLPALIPEPQSFSSLIMVVAALSLILSGPALLVLLTVVVLTWRKERRVIAVQLADEVRTGVVTPEDYSELSSSWRRTLSEFHMLFKRGIAYWRRLRKLHQAETELAFYKWHVSNGEGSRPSVVLRNEGQLRAEIRRIRAGLRTR